MKLQSDSDLIDKGVDVGLPFNGSAPDLGAFETTPLGLKDLVFEQGLHNYPNPFSTETHVIFHSNQTYKIGVNIFNLLGVSVFKTSKKTYPAGENSIIVNRNNLAPGNYLLVLEGEANQRFSKLITVK
jgi:hypothetical protein